MQIGAIFPQTEIGPDPAAIRDYVEAVEGMEFDYLFIADHVLGADPDHHEHVRGSYYTHHSVIHESLTTLAFIAALTTRVQLITGILILPQRQTALVAKQAAEIDVLSGGRLTLGIGVGWNHVEFEALGEDFANRGIRSEEQINLMRALWTQEVVNFDGRWHTVRAAGIKPLPIQRPIPVWFGAGGSAGPVPRDVVLRRIARMGDGWFPSFGPDENRPRGAGQNADLHRRGRTSAFRRWSRRPHPHARQVARRVAGRSGRLAIFGRDPRHGGGSSGSAEFGGPAHRCNAPVPRGHTCGVGTTVARAV